MENKLVLKIGEKIKFLQENHDTDKYIINQGTSLYRNGQAQILAQGKEHFEFSVDDKYNDFEVTISVNGDVTGNCNCKSKDWCHHKVAGLLQLSETITRYEGEKLPEGKKYTREGMVRRVLEERKQKSLEAKYRIYFSNNIYGEHELLNEKGIKYKLTFRNIEKEQGYCSCPDYQTNKLGTCKHLMFAFNKMKTAKRKLSEKLYYPFVEIHLDPFADYKIGWFYPHPLPAEIQTLFKKYFNDKNIIEEEKVSGFLGFVKESANFKQILIRPEVLDKLEDSFNQKILDRVKNSSKLDYSCIKATLYPYQKEGIEFAAFRDGAVIADEMGLGKTMQAMGTALMKKELFGFDNTLIICPASLKSQWKSEIEKFSDEKAIIVDGLPAEREKLYQSQEAFFTIINYETVLRDSEAINKKSFDFIILDEAQRIKNYETITANAVKSLKKKHSLVITGTPIENKLIDLYSIAEFIRPGMLSPLWEFSYQHCYFDQVQKNKITGYYNLQHLKERMKSHLIRREKKEVVKQLRQITQLNVPVEMHPKQQEYHASYANGIAQILAKKFKTPYDMQKLTMLLQSMRMVCDSTYLVDKETNFSPKMIELEDVLFEKLDLKNNQRKIIIFSEWKRMNHIIGKMLNKNDISFVELSGNVPVKKRHLLIKEFEKNAQCRVFISTEAGGSGLNLQVADTVINFELPWNPAKKNQRIGRIDRIGQKNENLTVINFITRNSIEVKIASGLSVKQNLFDNVLSSASNEDIVDFSQQGRAQFLQELEMAMAEFTNPATTEDFEKTEDHPPTLFDIAAETENPAVSIDKAQIAQEESEKKKQIQRMEEMENVMNQGMGFLSGLFKMATGKDMAAEGNKIEVNRETGEVIMRFKMPVF